MTDRALKAMTEDLETPDFDDPAFTLPVPLEQAKVAIVPGEAFGAGGGARLSFALGDDDLGEGVGRIVEFLS